MASLLALTLSPSWARAQEAPAPAEPSPALATGTDLSPAAFEAAGVTPGQYRANNTWILVAAALVFLMHLGFGCVESGLCQAKNAANILTKNFWIICTGILAYWAWGFGAHYPSEWVIDGVIALGSPLDVANVGSLSPGYYEGSYTAYTDFIFQAMFAATAATIVSGAVAERIKLLPFMIFAVVFVLLGYPLVGSWHWGGGWLSQSWFDEGIGFHDFAGSSMVHAFGGWGALAGVLLLGPRRGKYGLDGRIHPIPAHNLPLVNIGTFLLFLGWFGFNGGSILSAAETTYTADGRISPGVDFVFVTTALSGVAGGAVALITSWFTSEKPDLAMGLNGALAGLVGITAGADVISPGSSIIVGAIAGLLIVLSVHAFDRLRIDDPVGAISVHGVCGIWGTLAVGLFAMDGVEVSFLWQLTGTLIVSASAFGIALVIFAALTVAGGIRVSESEEIDGLDQDSPEPRPYYGLPGEALVAPVVHH